MDDGELLRELARRLGTPAPSPLAWEVLAAYVASPEFLELRDRKTELTRIAHVFEHLGFARVADLNLATLDRYRLARADEPGIHHGAPSSPSTRNREVKRLSRALSWAVERGIIATNPIAHHPNEAEPPRRQTSITSDDVDALRAGAMKLGKPLVTRLALRAMIAVAFDSFLRRGEVCRLRWSMLDFKAGAILLPQSETKAHRDTVRMVPLYDRSIADIKAMPRDLESPFVFLTSRRAPWHPRTFLRYLQLVARDVGVRGAAGETFTAHDLRAGGASEQLEHGTPERELMDFAGWTTRDMIDRYHRRRGASAVQRARERIERARSRRP